MPPIASPIITPKGYAVVKTPDDGSVHRLPTIRSRLHTWCDRHPYVGNLLQLLVVIAMGVFIYGQTVYFHPLYQNTIRVNIGTWWDVPKVASTDKNAPKGHPEMVRPTFFTLFCIIPLLAIVFFVEWLRHFNLRRISSYYVLQGARILRRKPGIAGHLSYWSYGEWLFFLLVVLGNILTFYWGADRRITKAKDNAKKMRTTVPFRDYLDTIGVTLGFNCVYNMAFLFLPATRNSAWMVFFNLSYASNIKYHRWLGVATVLSGVAHAIAFGWLWIHEGEFWEQALPCFDCPLDSKKGGDVWLNIFGELALLLFLIIGLTSMPFIRRQYYNIFYYSHQLFGFAVILAVMHYGGIVWWILPTFVIYVYHRAISSSHAWAPVQVVELTAVSDSIVKLVLTRSTTMQGEYQLGNFIYVHVPAISSLQWHAFTIASSPSTHPHTLTVFLKNLGDWTQDLVHYAKECQEQGKEPVVYMDGYYGASLEAYKEYSTLCLIGGGIGVTPLLAILEDVVMTQRIEANEITHHHTLSQRIEFIFAFHELALLEEMHPVFQQLQQADPLGERLHLHLYLTREPTEETLETVVNYERLQRKQTTHETNSKALPFYEPLRGRASLPVLLLMSFTVFVIVGLIYNGRKIDRSYKYLWPLEQFTEIIVLFVSILVVYGCILMERIWWKRTTMINTTQDMEMVTFEQKCNSMYQTVERNHVHTYRDLIIQYQVTIGPRPNIEHVLKEVLHRHTTGTEDEKKSVIGVFVSGPEALKSSTEHAMATLGSSHFDLHEEQFEL